MPKQALVLVVIQQIANPFLAIEAHLFQLLTLLILS